MIKELTFLWEQNCILAVQKHMYFQISYRVNTQTSGDIANSGHSNGFCAFEWFIEKWTPFTHC